MKEEDYSKSIEVFSGSPWEAEIIKGLLESNDIRCVTKMELWVHWHPILLRQSLSLSLKTNTNPPPN